MPRRLRRTLGLRIAVVLAGLSAAASAAFSQAPSLAPTRTALTALEPCLGSDSKELKQLRQGLVWGWNNPKHDPPAPGHEIAPPPAVYVASLRRDAKACAFALQLKPGEERDKVIRAVRNDVVLKIADCRKFGMGRGVPVRVSTLRGPKTENGWAVFYRWNCASSFQPAELRVPQLTSPALLDLPPGEYSFRAEFKAAGAKPESAGPATVIVGGLQTTVVELPIP